MAVITAIDKAVNKDHHAAEAEKEREHQAEMNQQFMDMLDKQMGEFDAQNAAIWGMVGQSNSGNADIWNMYGGDDAATRALSPYAGGTQGGGTQGGGSMDEILAMFQSMHKAGPNYDAGGAANFDNGAGLNFQTMFNTGPNYDTKGNANFDAGAGFKFETPKVDPYASVGSNGVGGDPNSLWGQAGVNNSWALNTGAMMNLNDLIGYFDQRNAEKSRPSVYNQPAAQAPTQTPADDPVTLDSVDSTPETRAAGSGDGNADKFRIDLPSSVPAGIRGEIEDLALKIENAVSKGVISEAEGDRLLRDLQGRAKELGGEPETGDDIAVKNGRVWGDPHFVCADGGKYDVQGEAGKTYNILSDRGIQLNAEFDEWGGKGSGLTTIGQVGITIGDDQVQFGKDGKLKINGEEVGEGKHLDGAVELKDGKLSVKGGEYSFEVHTQKHNQGDHLNIENIRSDNATADGVLPSGLWGGTVDGDGKARNGDAGKGTQGGGAIDDVDGNVTQRGDKDTVKTYEVDGLFDTKFENHNKFADKPDPAADELAADVDRITGQLDQLAAIQKQAGEVLDELDMRVAKGQISPEAADKVRADVAHGLEVAKEAVLKPGEENSIFGKPFSDDELLDNVMANLQSIDSNLNELARSSEKAGGAAEVLRGVSEAVGGPAAPVLNEVADKLEAAEVDRQIKTLEWA
jgi:hypothetical protein